jgi:hypothetical protein
MDANALQRMRAVPLDTVLEGFGAQRDPKDPRRNWKFGDRRLTVTGDKFFDHNQEKGGGGALDLTLHLMGRDFKHPSGQDFRDAARWLNDSERVAPTAVQRKADQPLHAAPRIETRQQEPPVPDAARLSRVRWYLTHERAIPEALVERAIEKGRIFADSKANVVFRLHDAAGREVGYEKRGTYGKLYHSVQGEKGLFFAGGTSSRVAAFVESGIEALSYQALRGNVLAISTTGNAIEMPQKMARRLLERGFKIVAAFNADRDGDRFAERFAERLDGTVERDRPAERLGKDWNLVLRAQREQGVSKSVPPIEPTR